MSVRYAPAAAVSTTPPARPTTSASAGHARQLTRNSARSTGQATRSTARRPTAGRTRGPAPPRPGLRTRDTGPFSHGQTGVHNGAGMRPADVLAPPIPANRRSAPC